MKISSLRLFAAHLIIGGAWVLAPPEAAGCGLQWSLPKAHFDGVDEQGHVLYAETIGTLDLGDDTTIPLHIMFKSNWNLVSPFLGKGWMLPALESRMIQLDEGRYVLWQPDGWYRMFGRSKEDANILNGQGGWKAQIQGDSITAWAPCGMKLSYTKGKIMNLEMPPKKDAATARGRKLEYTYRDGRLTGLRLDGAEKLSVDTVQGVGESRKGGDVETGVVRALVFRDGKRVGIEQVHGSSPLLGDRAVHGATVSASGGLSDGAGQTPATAGFPDTLNGSVKPERTLKLTLADGTVRTYEFGVNAKRQPTLRVSTQPLNREPSLPPSDPPSEGDRWVGTVELSRIFIWDAETRRIVQDGDWTYEVRGDAKHPEANAAIGRKNSQGQSEFFHHDDARGQEIVQGADGARTVKSWFVSGPAVGKFRKIENIADGKSDVIYRAAYDEKGRLIRETKRIEDADQMTEFRYDGTSDRVIAALRNGQPLLRRRYDDAGRVIEVDYPGVKTFRYRYLPDGAREITLIKDALSVVGTFDLKHNLVNLTNASFSLTNQIN